MSGRSIEQQAGALEQAVRARDATIEELKAALDRTIDALAEIRRISVDPAIEEAMYLDGVIADARATLAKVVN